EVVGAYAFLWGGLGLSYLYPEAFTTDGEVDPFSAVFVSEGVFNAVSLVCVCIIACRVYTSTKASSLSAMGHVHPASISRNQVIMALFFRSLVSWLFLALAAKVVIVAVLDIFLFPDEFDLPIYSYTFVVY
ncbi:hypothetical protein KIPB_016765, partial [Kipferlia bialata]